MTMTAKELADAIVEVVERKHDATHGTLIAHFGDLVRGDRELIIDPPNACIAGRASVLLGEAIDILRFEKPARIIMEVAPRIVALTDGIPMPDPKLMPWIVSEPKNGGSLAKTHFAPFLLVMSCEYRASRPHPMLTRLEKNIMQGLRDSRR
jgi:hypothetical protein